MKPGLNIGQIGELTVIVDPTMTITLGDLSQTTVFSTPAMIMLMELRRPRGAVPISEADEESVGVDVQVEHLAATVLGATVRGVARVTAIDGRRIHFTISAYDGDREIGRGTHRLAMVSMSRIVENLAKAGGDNGQAMNLAANPGELPELKALLVSVTNGVATVTLNRLALPECREPADDCRIGVGRGLVGGTSGRRAGGSSHRCGRGVQCRG